jgi:hypothetical protein
MTGRDIKKNQKGNEKYRKELLHDVTALSLVLAGLNGQSDTCCFGEGLVDAAVLHC